jgi:hypothetical protein
MTRNGVKYDFFEVLYKYLMTEDISLMNNLTGNAFQTLSFSVYNKASFSDAIDPLNSINNYLRLPNAMDLFCGSLNWLGDITNGKSL